jgi:chaperonin GroES
MNLKPIRDQVIIERVEREEKTESGVILKIGKSQTFEGKVLAVGPGKYSDKGDFKKTQIKVGQEVILDIGNGEMIELDGKKYLVVPESLIVAVRE